MYWVLGSRLGTLPFVFQIVAEKRKGTNWLRGRHHVPCAMNSSEAKAWKFHSVSGNLLVDVPRLPLFHLLPECVPNPHLCSNGSTNRIVVTAVNQELEPAMANQALVEVHHRGIDVINAVIHVDGVITYSPRDGTWLLDVNCGLNILAIEVVGHVVVDARLVTFGGVSALDREQVLGHFHVAPSKTDLLQQGHPLFSPRRLGRVSANGEVKSIRIQI
mmetsp:Transcript_14052/g.21874  ORF Transcript_14052/g.21874 Transcript_14052/m.21874 type:complete len:217 (-) Transcript_14052:464-1114(-)